MSKRLGSDSFRQKFQKWNGSGLPLITFEYHFWDKKKQSGVIHTTEPKKSEISVGWNWSKIGVQMELGHGLSMFRSQEIGSSLISF